MPPRWSHTAWKQLAWPQFARNAGVILALAGITGWFAISFDKRAKGTDFPDFYCAARMVLDGQGNQLYHFHTQDQFQIRYAGRTGTYYIHPPFETLVYLPFSLWTLSTAYLLWCIFNAGMLAFTAVLFQRHIVTRWNWRLLLLLFFVFPPVLLNFLQGQDSVLLLLMMTLAVAALKRNRDFAAGCFLGCALFKFHLVLTFFLLLASLARKNLIAGFTLLLTILLLISAGISGWSFLNAYPRFLMSLSGLPLAGIHLAQMANIRGLVAVSGLGPYPVLRSAVTLMASLSVFAYAWLRFRDGKLKFAGARNLAIGNFIFVAILVSYHLSPHDLCIALLPIGLISQSFAENARLPRSTRFTLLTCLLLLFLPPLHLILLAWHVYPFMSIPILIIFSLISALLWHPLVPID